MGYKVVSLTVCRDSETENVRYTIRWWFAAFTARRLGMHVRLGMHIVRAYGDVPQRFITERGGINVLKSRTAHVRFANVISPVGIRRACRF